MVCFGPIVRFLMVALLTVKASGDTYCDRRPFSSSLPNPHVNNIYNITVLQTYENTYIPDQQYVVRLMTTDPTRPFTEFMITADAEPQTDPNNPRRPIIKDPGTLRPHEQYMTKYSERCYNAIEQVNAAPKIMIEAYWVSPKTGNGCVTLHAMVAENEEVWYMDEGPLSHRVCEDTSQPGNEEMTPNDNCQACSEAKYELTFEGLWTRNSHPQHYPENSWLPRFSDLVGASHDINYRLWSEGQEASRGLQTLAELSNTTALEEEIRNNFGSVRTLIKGKGHGHPKITEPTYSLFRVDRTHHLVSTATGVYPSPDWFVGVSQLELCQADNTWLPEQELKLFPWDAGTDSGISYESQDKLTDPKDYISRVRVGSFNKESPFHGMNARDLKPFANLRIRLIRTYDIECSTDEESAIPEVDEEANEATKTTQPQTDRYRTSPQPIDDSSGVSGNENPTSDEACRLSEWEDWSECLGACGHGYQFRRRFHLVDGKPYLYAKGMEPPSNVKKPSPECEEAYEKNLFESHVCPGNCASVGEPQPRRPIIEFGSEGSRPRSRKFRQVREVTKTRPSERIPKPVVTEVGSQIQADIKSSILVKKPSSSERVLGESSTKTLTDVKTSNRVIAAGNLGMIVKTNNPEPVTVARSLAVVMGAQAAVSVKRPRLSVDKSSLKHRCKTTPWSPWSVCMGSCYLARQYRARSVVDLPPTSSQHCVEPLIETRKCTLKDC